MSGHLTMLAVREKDEDKVLSAAQNYYSKLGVEIVEEGIGDRKSQFMKEPHQYKDLSDFREKKGFEEKGEMLNSFDFFTNLQESPEYSVFLFGLHTEKLSINLDLDLAKFLSSSLSTETIVYYYRGYVGAFYISTFVNGENTDSFFAYQRPGTWLVSGYFEKFKDKYFDSVSDLQETVLWPYYKKTGFDPESEEFNFYYLEKWRRLRLEGKIEDVGRYLLKLEDEMKKRVDEISIKPNVLNRPKGY